MGRRSSCPPGGRRIHALTLPLAAAGPGAGARGPQAPSRRRRARGAWL